MTELLQTLASYTPHLILRRIAAHPEPITAPTSEQFSAAVMYADITGFTALTERLESIPHAEQGAGAEAVTQLVNAYFDQLIDLIHNHGGDVVKFTGDGLLALWTVDAAQPAHHFMHSLKEAVQRAAQCGLRVQETLHDYPTTGGNRLAMRLGIGVGDMFMMHLGGVFNRWEFLVAGNPLSQTSVAEKQAHPGQVVLSPSASTLIREACKGVPLSFQDPTAPGGEGIGLLLEAIADPIPPHPLADIPLAPEVEAALRPYIPAGILTKLDAGQSAWLSELRRVTVLFINLPDLDHTGPESLERAQQAIRALQKAIYRQEGSLNKINVDDKGATLVAVLGLPPFSHTDDPARGVLAGMAAEQALRELGMHATVGAATGLTFCGVLGSSRRREYTIMGDTVNLAARLMQAAQDNAARLNPDAGRILCDLNTFSNANLNVDFEVIPPILIKGKRNPVPVYQPLQALKHQLSTGEKRAEWAKALVGRAEERFSIAKELQALQRGGPGAVFIIEGDAGIGKSRLAIDLLDQAGALGMASLVGIADAIEQSTPYHAWRPVFMQILNVDEISTLENNPLRDFSRMFPDPELIHLFPLVDAVLKMDLPDNEFTAEMEGQVRADNTRKLLVRLFQATCEEAPTVLVMEDTQWLDSASWALLLDIWAHVKPLLLVIATRPVGDSPPPEYLRILQSPGTRHLHLKTLSPSETVDLVCRCLGVSQIPDPVSRLIRRKAEGHPFYSQELAYSLRDNQYLQFSNGSCKLTPGVDLAALSFPNTVQGVIINRIDNLPPPEQLILKVASVIGRVFPYEPLYDIYPLANDKPHLRTYLDALSVLDITPQESPAPNLSYIFKHIITQEVSYNLLPFAQRQQLHRATAEWYERRYQDDLLPYYSLLAHHWSNASVAERAVDYYEKAGQAALHGGAYREAIHAFEQAIHWDKQIEREAEEASVPVTPQKRIPASQFRRSRWKRRIGQACIGLGQVPASLQHITNALELLERSVPDSPPELAASLLWHAGKQVSFRLLPANSTRFPPEARPVLLEAARAYSLLTETYFYQKENIAMAHAAIRTLNLAEQAGPSPELAHAYANMGMLMAIVRVHRLARFYLQRARETAQGLNRSASRAYVELITTLYSLGTGDWEQVRRSADEAIHIFRQLGDHRRLGEVLSLKAIHRHFLGKYELSNQTYMELHQLGERTGDIQQQTWGLDGQAANLLRIGDLNQAAELLAQTESLFEQSNDRAEETVYYGTLAVLRLYQGDKDAARQSAAKALEKGSGVSPVYSTFVGYAGTAEVFLALWEAAGDPDLAAYARQACKALRSHTNRFPFGKPRFLVWQGLYDWLTGKHAKAHKSWQNALEAAQSLGMLYEEALARQQIARHLPTGDPERKKHAELAEAIFNKLARSGI